MTDKEIGVRELDYARDFWTTANLVTAFSVAQAIAFGIAASSEQGSLFRLVPEHRCLVVAMTDIATGAYLLVVLFCHRAHQAIIADYIASAALRTHLCWWNVMRVATVLLVGGSPWSLSLPQRPGNWAGGRSMRNAGASR